MKSFNNNASVNSFRKELARQKKVLYEKGHDPFSEICTKGLDKHALKKRSWRSNHKTFMNNEMSKAIMARTKLGNRFLKNMRNRDRYLFLKQKNLCVNIKRKSEKDYLT